MKIKLLVEWKCQHGITIPIFHSMSLSVSELFEYRRKFWDLEGRVGFRGLCGEWSFFASQIFTLEQHTLGSLTPTNGDPHRKTKVHQGH